MERLEAGTATTPMKDVMEELGITEDELAAAEDVAIE